MKHQHSLSPFSKWLPTPGNLLFTLFLVALLFGYVHRVEALSSRDIIQPISASSTTTFPYQGRLTDTNGNPVNTTVAITFRLYNVASGGTPLWTESWPSVQVSEGLFNVLLGSNIPIPLNLITDNASLWLGLSVGSDSEMIPRAQVGSVPFAEQAITVPDGAITSEKLGLQHYSVQLDYYQTSSTTYVDIPGSAITFTVNTTSTVLVGFTGSLFTLMQGDSAAAANLTVNLDGVDRDDVVDQNLFAWSGSCCVPNPAISPAGFSTLLTVGPGEHVIKLRVLSFSYNPGYRFAGIGYNLRKSSFSVVVLGQ